MVAQAASIISRLSTCFEKAKESGDLLFFPSTVHRHVEGNIEYHITLCPALQNKPNLPAPHFPPTATEVIGVNGGKPDPFAPPYTTSLFVSELKDNTTDLEYAILLNKFSVVPMHFLMVTKDFQSQISPLLPADLTQVYALLHAARKDGKHFFAFYNCGERSGASQAHKHIQFIPTDDDGPPVEQLAKAVNLESSDKTFSLNSLPFATHVRRLPHLSSSHTSSEELTEALSSAFLSLLDLAIGTVCHDPTYPAGLPSYNVILTLSHIFVIPRKHEETVLAETGDKIGVNALGFAGMLLVKNEKELEAVKKQGITSILEDVAMKKVDDKLINEPHEVDEA